MWPVFYFGVEGRVKLDLSLPDLFFDKKLKNLISDYRVESCPDEHVPSSLGWTESEIVAKDFLGVSKFCGDL